PRAVDGRLCTDWEASLADGEGSRLIDVFETSRRQNIYVTVCLGASDYPVEVEAEYMTRPFDNALYGDLRGEPACFSASMWRLRLSVTNRTQRANRLTGTWCTADPLD
ncbi:MAG: hypothetical protein HXY25_02390, partial [Alphaproteobacteria bacterium]|nr:hypothetical protein [Alphaproteobacteria bacterium]